MELDTKRAAKPSFNLCDVENRMLNRLNKGNNASVRNCQALFFSPHSGLHSKIGTLRQNNGLMLNLPWEFQSAGLPS
jgi:hypothetical protein